MTLAPITGAWGATPLSNLILRPQDGFTELLVPGAGRLLCDHSSQEAADGHPVRIVLDFCDADHALGQQTFDGLPPTVISRIRTSQYAQAPQRIVRIVLDLRKSATYTVNTEQNAATIRIVDPDRALFTLWEANPGARPTLASKAVGTTPAKPAATTPAQTATKTTTPNQTVTTVADASRPGASAAEKTTAQKPNAPKTTTVTMGPPTPTSGANNQTTAAAPAGQSPSSSELAKKATTVSAPVTPAPTSTASAATQQSTQHATKTTPGDVKKGSTPATSSAAERSEAATTSTPPVATLAPTTKPAPVALIAPPASGVGTTGQSSMSPPVFVQSGTATPVMGTSRETTPDGGYVPPKRPLVLAPEYLYGDDQVAQSSSTDQEKVPVAQVSMEPLGPKTPTAQQGGVSAAATAAPGSPVLASTSTLPIMNKTTDAKKPADTTLAASGAKQGQETLFERLRSKFFNEQTPPRPYTSVDLQGTEDVTGDSQTVGVYGPPTPIATLTREELLEKVRQAAQSAGVQSGQLAGEESVSLVNKVSSRNTLIYDDMGRRDPFAPLTKGLRSGFISDQLPSVENLRLVGVLRDNHEALALLENLEGYGYVLHVGDRIENGAVVAIEENRVLFRVQDYGWSHIVALQLTTRGADPSKSLGAKPPVQLQYEEATPMQEPVNKSTETPKTESANP